MVSQPGNVGEVLGSSSGLLVAKELGASDEVDFPSDEVDFPSLEVTLCRDSHASSKVTPEISVNTSIRRGGCPIW